MGKKIDLTGQRFGRLVVVKEVGRRYKQVIWGCVCDCGNKVDVAGYSLRRGYTLSCGCLRNERTRAANVRNLSGKRFGRLVALKNIGSHRTKNHLCVVWLCHCDCGEMVEKKSVDLLQGRTRSCGCLTREKYIQRAYSRLGLSCPPAMAAAKRIVNQQTKLLKEIQNELNTDR